MAWHVRWCFRCFRSVCRSSNSVARNQRENAESSAAPLGEVALNRASLMHQQVAVNSDSCSSQPHKFALKAGVCDFLLSDSLPCSSAAPAKAGLSLWQAQGQDDKFRRDKFDEDI
jgi:hypothetical protein